MCFAASVCVTHSAKSQEICIIHLEAGMKTHTRTIKELEEGDYYRHINYFVSRRTMQKQQP